MTPSKVNVMFVQSQPYFGSDSMIHSLIMKNLNRDKFVVHAAVNRGDLGEESASLKALDKIPNLHIRPTHFGPTTHFRTRSAIARDTIASAPPATLSLTGLVRYVRRNNITLLHGTEKPRDAFYGVLLGKLTGAKMIIHVHVGIDLTWIKPTTQWAMRNAAALLGVSEFVAQTARDAGFDPNKVYSVVNSLDSSTWVRGDETKLRREFNIPQDMPVMVIASRINPYKGHKILLQSLAQIKHQRGYDNFKLLIIGEDDPRSTPDGVMYTTVLQKLIAELDLADQVIFTGFRKDVRDLMSGTDIYTMPSHREPCAVAFIEASATSLPIIALNNGGTPELIVHGVTGLLSNEDDVDAMAANVYTLLSDPDLRRQMGLAGRKRVEDYLNPQRMTRDVEHVYQQVLQTASPQRSR